MQHKKRRAKYQLLVDDIRARIETGQLRPGDQLPSIPQLAEAAGCGTVTVKSALLILRTTGFLYGRPGIGVFVAGDDQ